MQEPDRASCSHCQAELKIKDPSYFGKKCICPKCQKSFILTASPIPEEQQDQSLSDEDLPTLRPLKKPKAKKKVLDEEPPKKPKKKRSRVNQESDIKGVIWLTFAVISGLGAGAGCVAEIILLQTGSPKGNAVRGILAGAYFGYMAYAVFEYVKCRLLMAGYLRERSESSEADSNEATS